MFPISDDNPRPRLRTPFVTWLLLGACVAVFVYQFTLPQDEIRKFIFAYGMVPAKVFGSEGLNLQPYGSEIHPFLTIITSMFLHGGIMHIVGNMLYLWIFGDNIEDAMGSFGFLIFYLLCGIVAALTQGFLTPTSNIPMVGASGAISGVLGAYLVLFPRAGINVLIFFGIITFVTVPAIVVLGFWFVVQLVNGLLIPPDQPGVAFWAHIGGFVAGVVLHPLFISRSGAGRSDRGRRGPWG